MAVTSIGSFTFSVLPVVVYNSGWVLNTTLTGSSSESPVYVYSIVDPTSVTRVFNPIAEGNPVVQGTDAYSVWLPSLQGNISATTVNDQYWAPAGGTVPNPNNKIGQVQLSLVPAAKNTVEASSVMRYYLSPQALVIAVTAGTF